MIRNYLISSKGLKRLGLLHHYDEKHDVQNNKMSNQKKVPVLCWCISCCGCAIRRLQRLQTGNPVVPEMSCHGGDGTQEERENPTQRHRAGIRTPSIMFLIHQVSKSDGFCKMFRTKRVKSGRRHHFLSEELSVAV